MTIKKKRKFRLWWIIPLAFTGLVLYYVLVPGKLPKLILPDFSKVEEVDVLISNDTINLNARGVFESESFLPLIVDSLYYQFFIEDSIIYERKKLIDINLVPGENDTVNIDIHVPFQRIRNISKHIQPRDSVLLGVTCQVVYKYFNRRFMLEFTKKGKILTPVPPRIKLLGIKKKKISDWGKNIETEARLLVINDSKKLNIDIKDLKYNIVVGDKIKGAGRYGSIVKLKPRSQQVITIPVSLDVNKPLKVVWQLLFDKDKVNYDLHATAMVNLNTKKGHPDIRVDMEVKGDTEFSMGKK